MILNQDILSDGLCSKHMMTDAYDIVSSFHSLWFSCNFTHVSLLGTFKVSSNQFWAYKVQAMYRLHECLPDLFCFKGAPFKYGKLSSCFLQLCCISLVKIVHRWYKDFERICEMS